MSLAIATFDNKSRSGDPLFKALGHPAVAPRIRAWIAEMGKRGAVAVVDPWGQFSCLDALYDLSALTVSARYVQRIEDLPANQNTHANKVPVLPLSELAHTNAGQVMLAAFDADLARRSLAPLIEDRLPVFSFDDLKLEERYLTNTRKYLDPLNFATNFALFRAGEGRHSVVRTAEYWSGYGAAAPRLWLTLLSGAGETLASWEEDLVPGQSIAIDAEKVRQRFSLPLFSGMLLIHAIGVSGHDQVKYVLDDVDDAGADPAVTHDSNSWPAAFYTGLPAPRPGEVVRLWLQNAHPGPVPAGAIVLNLMGDDKTVALPEVIPGFGTVAIDTRTLFPDAVWPQQIELASGQHVVRPRYEIVGWTTKSNTVTFAHMNVERTDLKPDPAIAKAMPLLGKGYLLPAPILPLGAFESVALVTPAARAQEKLPLKILAYDAQGKQVLEKKLGVAPRDKMPALVLNRLLEEAGITDPAFQGHMELLYDFESGLDVDGWLHALFRYTDLASGQTGDTSFGAHMFNLPVTFKDEPQSYAGKPPGLSSRLFARLVPAPLDAFVYLIYPSSDTWRPHSDTLIELKNEAGAKIAETHVAIPLHGSRWLKASELFPSQALKEAGPNGTMLILDRTCRLFGYHGVIGPDGQFCLDHMFGF